MAEIGCDGPRQPFWFTLRSKHAVHLNHGAALFHDAEDPFKFSYLADHPLAAKFEAPTVVLARQHCDTVTCCGSIHAASTIDVA